MLSDKVVVDPPEELLCFVTLSSPPQAPKGRLVKTMGIPATHMGILVQVGSPRALVRQGSAQMTPLPHLRGNTFLISCHPQVHTQCSQSVAVADIAQRLLQRASDSGCATE